MIAHHTNGKRYAATAYNTSTVTLATRSGRPDVVTWAEILYLEDKQGLQRHRDVVNGMPTIIVQPPPPPSVPCPPVDIPLSKCPQNDFEDAIALIDQIDNAEAREAVRAALSATFEGGDKRRLWGMLTVEQKERLK